MTTKTISITALSLFTLLVLGVSPAHAQSEVTGTLSGGSSQTDVSSAGGSISGTVAGAGTISGTVISSTGSGGSGGSSGSSSSGGGGGSNSGGGSVLGATTDMPSTTYPGLPDTGMSHDGSVGLIAVLVALLALSLVPLRVMAYRKI